MPAKSKHCGVNPGPANKACCILSYSKSRRGRACQSRTLCSSNSLKCDIESMGFDCLGCRAAYHCSKRSCIVGIGNLCLASSAASRCCRANGVYHSGNAVSGGLSLAVAPGNCFRCHGCHSRSAISSARASLIGPSPNSIELRVFVRS